MSDDSDNFKASQSGHAQDIRARRQIEKVFGVSAAQARKALLDFHRQQKVEENQVATHMAFVPEPINAKVVEEVTKFRQTGSTATGAPLPLPPLVTQPVELKNLLPPYPTTDGDYFLRITIVDEELTEMVWEVIGDCDT